uniref:Putative secreted peptide n=1 Tax=Anopheles braziliensis TaxID=58242 RepID=A0A2M3ZSN2_9DIPT
MFIKRLCLLNMFKTWLPDCVDCSISGSVGDRTQFHHSNGNEPEYNSMKHFASRGGRKLISWLKVVNRIALIYLTDA